MCACVPSANPGATSPASRGWKRRQSRWPSPPFLEACQGRRGPGPTMAQSVSLPPTSLSLAARCPRAMFFYRPGSTANLFRLSYTHPPSPLLLVPSDPAQTRRGQRPRNALISCLYHPWSPSPPRASPMSCAAPPSVHTSTCTVVQPTHTQTPVTRRGRSTTCSMEG